MEKKGDFPLYRKPMAEKKKVGQKGHVGRESMGGGGQDICGFTRKFCLLKTACQGGKSHLRHELEGCQGEAGRDYVWGNT